MTSRTSRSARSPSGSLPNVYLPKLRDGVVLQGAIRDAVAKLDPAFGYADSFDESSSEYRGLVWAKRLYRPGPRGALSTGVATALPVPL